MNRTHRAVAAALTATSALIGLSACGSDTGEAESLPTVRGRLDDVKHVSMIARHSFHMVPTKKRICKPVTRTVSSGSGKNRSSRTVTSQSCSTIVVGQHRESFLHVVRAEKWCVELDQVNRDIRRNDHWFTVDRETYDRWNGRSEGARVKRMPYLRPGC